LRRTLTSLLVTAIAATALAGAARARPPEVATYAYGSRVLAPQAAVRLGQASDFTGGPVTAADGEVVNVFVEDPLLAANPNAAQHWADVLAGLLHGTELSQLTLYVATLDRLRQICGTGALGCYGDGRIVAIGEDLHGVSAQSVITHEYGHHLANSRRNDPWPAVDWGAKRWASYENVCRRAKFGEVVPGDEGRFYQLNSGEAFAEDYRVLNERWAGIPESTWQVVDQSLYPSQAALDALALDVTNPWTQSTAMTYRVVMGAQASGRGFRLATPLDGSFRATLRSGPKVTLTLRIIDLASGNVLAADQTPLRAKSLSVTICGQRSLQVQVKRVSGSGPFALTVSKA
jgi:hypothetical protein